MEILNKDNIDEFMNYYHYFHDSSINKIYYDADNRIVDVILNIYWSGEPTVKSDGSYDTHKSKMRMIFSEVDNYSNNDDYDFIDDAIVEYFEKDNKQLISFSLLSPYSDENACLSVVCEKIHYEIIND